MPYVLSKDGSNSIRYIYDASGAKLCKEATVNGTTTRRYYCGSMEYDDTKALSLIHTDEGLVEVSGSGSNITYNYEYFLKDHLGNTRVVVNSSGSLLQRSDYYPFGLTADQYSTSTDNKYLYNGKELQQDLGLGWYDYEHRFYDPQVGRFTTIDPLAAKYPKISPYVYCINNPIKYIDPNGKDWVLNNETKKYTWMDDVTSSKQAPKGYTYVGANNESLLKSMGVKSSYEQKQTRRFFTLGSDQGEMEKVPTGAKGGGLAAVTLLPAAKGALQGTKAEGNINITANVSYNQKDASDNNESGIVFQGVTVTGRLSQENDEVTATGGSLTVKNGNNTYNTQLGESQGTIIQATGTTVTEASVIIPASQITFGSLTNANISAGTTNNEIMYIAPVSIDFNLQQTNSTISENE